MKAFPIPVVSIGPGSQPVDADLDFVRLPEMLATFHMPPRPHDVSPAALAEARAFLAELHAAAAASTLKSQSASRLIHPRIQSCSRHLLKPGLCD